MYFPEPDHPDLAPFTRAFLRMMFAHVEFERRVAELADLITLTLGFGETLVCSAKDRPKKFGKLCGENQSKHLGGLPEAGAIVRCLDEAFHLCNDRNWLAHGVWWRLDGNVIDVHAVRSRSDEPVNREFTAEQIQQVANSFLDIQAELWKLQRAINERLPPELLPPEYSE